MVYCGTSSGGVVTVDLREPACPPNLQQQRSSKAFTAHTKKVTCVDFCPSKEHLLVTSSLDCTVALWDTRKLQSLKPISPPVVFGRAVNSAYFRPESVAVTGTSVAYNPSVVATSYDNTIRILNLERSCDKFSEKAVSIHHNNETGRWLTAFRAVWDPQNATGIVVGSMAQPRSIDIYNGISGKRVTVLQHENLTCVTSAIAFHPTLKLLVGGNSSGRLYLFRAKPSKS